MNRVEINGLDILRWDVPNESMPELIAWLNENGESVKVSSQEIDTHFMGIIEEMKVDDFPDIEPIGTDESIDQPRTPIMPRM